MQVLSAADFHERLSVAVAEKISPVGDTAQYSVPTREDLAEEEVRINARLHQWGCVQEPDPALVTATEGLRVAKEGVPLGPLNALPTYSNAASQQQRAANAAHRHTASARVASAAPVTHRPVDELIRDFGADLAGMDKEALLAQLCARHVPESRMVGKQGGSRQAQTLRRLLLSWDVDQTPAAAATAPAPSPAAAADASAPSAAAVPPFVSPLSVPRRTASARLLRGLAGSDNWVSCDACGQWRRLPNTDKYSPDRLPQVWTCVLNPDPRFDRCSDPEEDMESDEEWNEGDGGEDDGQESDGCDGCDPGALSSDSADDSEPDERAHRQAYKCCDQTHSRGLWYCGTCRGAFHSGCGGAGAKWGVAPGVGPRCEMCFREAQNGPTGRVTRRTLNL